MRGSKVFICRRQEIKACYSFKIVMFKREPNRNFLSAEFKILKHAQCDFDCRVFMFQVIKEKLHLVGGHGTETKESKSQAK